MQKTIIGILITSIALFAWGFIYWSINPIPYESWKKTADDEITQNVLREHFPESGTYFIPGTHHEPEMLNKLYARGPIGFVHINLEGADPADPTIMLQGFILNLIFISLMAAVFKMAKAQAFRDFARLSIVIGAAAVLLIDGSHIIWWQEPANWIIWQMLYNFTAWLLVGHLLGLFMKQSAEPS